MQKFHAPTQFGFAPLSVFVEPVPSLQEHMQHKCGSSTLGIGPCTSIACLQTRCAQLHSKDLHFFLLGDREPLCPSPFPFQGPPEAGTGAGTMCCDRHRCVHSIFLHGFGQPQRPGITQPVVIDHTWVYGKQGAA